MDDKYIRNIHTNVYKDITKRMKKEFCWDSSNCSKERQERDMRERCQYCLIVCQNWNITPYCEQSS
jgi:hypothetical protein